MEQYKSKAKTIVLFLILLVGIVICVLWWGMLVFFVIAGVRLLLHR